MLLQAKEVLNALMFAHYQHECRAKLDKMLSTYIRKKHKQLYENSGLAMVKTVAKHTQTDMDRKGKG